MSVGNDNESRNSDVYKTGKRDNNRSESRHSAVTVYDNEKNYYRKYDTANNWRYAENVFKAFADSASLHNVAESKGRADAENGKKHTEKWRSYVVHSTAEQASVFDDAEFDGEYDFGVF